MTLVGKRFAYRERARTLGEALHPVEVVKEGPPRSNRVRIRWLDGEYEGLEVWVPKVRLIVTWEERERFLDDERRLIAAIDACGDIADTTGWEGVQEVYFALPGDADISLGATGVEHSLLVINDFERAIPQLGLRSADLLAEPHAYVDRFGTYRAPFPVAARVARFCCQRYAQDVLRCVAAEEDALRQATVSGYYVAPNTTQNIEYHIVPSRAQEWLHEREPVFALIRESCGQGEVSEFNQLVAAQAEIHRLQQLIESTAQWLRSAGHPVKASLLLRELNRTKMHRHR